MRQERIVDAVWGELLAGYSLVVRVVANDRSGLLRDITTILANEGGTYLALPAVATPNGNWRPST